MTSVRPVNRLLGFGISGIIPSDVVVLALLMLLMLICQRSMRSACRAASNCSTHTVSCIEGAAAHGSSMSVCKNVSSAHSEWSKMSVRVQDEGGKETGALGCQETPIMPRGERVCWSIFKFYMHAHLCLAFSHTLPSSLLLAFVFLIPWHSLRLVGRLYVVACWLCLAPSGFTTRGCNPLSPKAPIMMGGALPLGFVEETRIFPYEFV